MGLTDILVTGIRRQLTSSVAITDTTPPVFAGVSLLTSDINSGGLLAQWSPASDPAVPVSYEVYVSAAPGAINVFQPSSLLAITRNLSFKILFLPSGDLLDNATYYVGVRARDAAGNIETNLVVASATALGVNNAPISVQDIPAIGQSVWNQFRSGLNTPGTFGEALQGVFSPTRASLVDTLTRLDVTLSTRASQASVSLIPLNTLLFTDPRLDNLDEKISTRSSAAQVTAVQSTLDSRLSALRASKIDFLDQAISSRLSSVDFSSYLSTFNTRLSASRANNLDNLDTLVSSRASQASVDSIQNNTSFVGVVPPIIVLPATGSKNYIFYARIFNDQGLPADADTNVVNIRVLTTAGGTVVPLTAMTRTGVGLYEYVYTVSASDPERVLNVMFDYTYIGNAFNHVRTAEVQEFESKLDTLLARLTSARAINLDLLDAAVSSRSAQTDINTLLARVSATRAANLDNLDAQVAPIATNVSAIKSKTDQVQITGGNVHARAEVVNDKTGYSTTNADKDVIADKVWDESLAGHTAPGSAGATLDTAASNTLSPPELTAIRDTVWNAPRSAHTVPNSFGEANQGNLTPARAAKLDNLDSTVSSRSSSASTSILSLLNADRIAALDRLDVAISTRASQASLNSVASDTNRIPVDPATEAAVTAIPTNPLLTTDPRLNNLDAPVSATATPADVDNLATTSELVQARDTIIANLEVWAPRFSMAINPTTDTAELIAWLTKNGSLVLDADECTVDVFDGDGALAFTVGPDMFANLQGVFKFSRANASIVLDRNKTYVAKVEIKRGAATFTANAPLLVF